LTFNSACHDFYLKTFRNAKITYNKNGFEFTIKKEEFDKYLAYIKKEYDVDFSQQIKNP